MKSTTLFFLRHGEVHNPQDILYARLPRFRLSERGRQEAEITAKFLRHEPIRVIYSSPMLRARQTAKIVQNYHPDAPVRVSQQLIEVKTSYQGSPRAEMQKIDWDFYTHRRDGDESLDGILARLRKQLDLTLKRHHGEKVVWVAHGDPVIIFTLWGQGRPLTDIRTYKGATYIGHASVTQFVFEPGRELPVSVEYFDPNKHQ
jgi:broad specificity phosphatase PhoE